MSPSVHVIDMVLMKNITHSFKMLKTTMFSLVCTLFQLYSQSQKLAFDTL